MIQTVRVRAGCLMVKPYRAIRGIFLMQIPRGACVARADITVRVEHMLLVMRMREKQYAPPERMRIPARPNAQNAPPAPIQIQMGNQHAPHVRRVRIQPQRGQRHHQHARHAQQRHVIPQPGNIPRYVNRWKISPSVHDYQHVLDIVGVQPIQTRSPTLMAFHGRIIVMVFHILGRPSTVTAKTTCVITSPFNANAFGAKLVVAGDISTGAAICSTPDVWDVSDWGVQATALDGDTCPDGFFTVPYEKTCGTGMVNTADVPNCADDTSGEYCLVTLVKPCELGISALKTSSGLSFALYAEKYTTPAINIGYNGGMCYANLEPGQSAGAINVSYNGQIYHTAK